VVTSVLVTVVWGSTASTLVAVVMLVASTTTGSTWTSTTLATSARWVLQGGGGGRLGSGMDFFHDRGLCSQQCSQDDGLVLWRAAAGSIHRVQGISLDN
jgi:hypothetical protein